ncbi:MAG TPA: hypothetical protein PLV25_07525 [Opitutales bacterium]|nr:hypothetical protein [Opitutales bacterium]
MQGLPLAFPSPLCVPTTGSRCCVFDAIAFRGIEAVSVCEHDPCFIPEAQPKVLRSHLLQGLHELAQAVTFDHPFDVS